MLFFLGLAKGGDEDAFGKPTHAQHVYLPYYQGEMKYTRKCIPSLMWSGCAFVS